MYNDMYIYVLFIISILLFNTLLSTKFFIIILLNIEALWLFFFFFNSYLGIFFENPIFFYLNIWLLCFSTCEIIIIVAWLNFFKN